MNHSKEIYENIPVKQIYVAGTDGAKRNLTSVIKILKFFKEHPKETDPREIHAGTNVSINYALSIIKNFKFDKEGSVVAKKPTKRQF